MMFSNVVRSEEELRNLMGDPIAPPVVEKTLSSLDRHCMAFIERALFVLIASSDSKGRMEISPKGDAPGFVKVLDEKTLLVPDRSGNQRFDTFPSRITDFSREFVVQDAAVEKRRDQTIVAGDAFGLRGRWMPGHGGATVENLLYPESMQERVSALLAMPNVALAWGRSCARGS